MRFHEEERTEAPAHLPARRHFERASAQNYNSREHSRWGAGSTRPLATLSGRCVTIGVRLRPSVPQRGGRQRRPQVRRGWRAGAGGGGWRRGPRAWGCARCCWRWWPPCCSALTSCAPRRSRGCGRGAAAPSPSVPARGWSSRRRCEVRGPGGPPWLAPFCRPTGPPRGPAACVPLFQPRVRGCCRPPVSPASRLSRPELALGLVAALSAGREVGVREPAVGHGWERGQH